MKSGHTTIKFVIAFLIGVVSFCLLALIASAANAEEGGVCRDDNAPGSSKLKALAGTVVCPNVGKDPDDVSTTSKIARGLDPTGLKSTTEVVMYGGQTTDRGANRGIKAYMGDAVRADRGLYDQATDFYTKLRAADAPYAGKTPYDCPIDQPATGKFDAWTEAKTAAHGDVYTAFRIMAMFGHDNEANNLTATVAAPSGCADRQAALNAIRPKMSSLFYRNNAIAGRAYRASDVTEGQRLAKQCKAAENYSDCGQLSGNCNDGHDDYQADYYHVIMAAFAGCRAHKYAVTVGTYPGKLAVQMGIAKKYKFDRFVEEIGYSDRGTAFPDQKKVVPELKRALAAAFTSLDCSLPSDLKFEGACATVARAVAERQAFEMCFRARQHAIGYEFGYNAGCN